MLGALSLAIRKTQTSRCPWAVISAFQAANGPWQDCGQDSFLPFHAEPLAQRLARGRHWPLLRAILSMGGSAGAAHSSGP